ncbi:MAG: DUF3299 domain-containing protein [Endozoicomonas sp.]
MKTGLKIIALSLLGTFPALNSIAAPVSKDSSSKAQAVTPKELGWDALMPKPDKKMIDQFQSGKLERSEVLSYLNKLGEVAVNDINNTYVRIPGYLVPLNIDKNQEATELLLVPTMGACLHVPPPPPNQTVYIRYKDGIEVEEAGYTPYWLTGTLKVEKNNSEYTDTLYAMTVEKIEIYK